MLPLSSYAHLLDLSPPTLPRPPLNLPPTILRETQLSVLASLLRELPYSPRLPSSADLESYTFSERDQLLRHLLTIRDPVELPPLPQNLTEQIDRLTRFRNERNPEPIVPVDAVEPISTLLYPTIADDSTLPPELSRIKFLQGDFTRLSCAGVAVVNPANTRMLGCFQPSHLCADNVLHAAAGPSLRADCAAVMRARDWQDVGTAEDVIATRAGVLDVGYVLHVAGPQLRSKGDRPTQEQEKELETVYRRCLDLAEELGTISTVAFPCISTGIFAFPSDLAARIALQTVSSWLSSHPSASSRVQDVLFVLFSPSDVEHYRAALSALYPSVPAPSSEVDLSRPAKVARLPSFIHDWVRDADSVVLHAGAGLSADAFNDEVGFGLDYTSEGLFAKLYPGLLERTEMRCLYHSIGYEFDDPLVKWAFILAHGYRALTWSPSSRSNPLYSSLLRYASSRPSPCNPYTVLTSNADNLFLQSGFSPSRVYTPQGSYATFQCTRPSCAHDPRGSTFPSFPYLQRAVEGGFVDPLVMRLPEDKAEELIPRCPLCGRSDGVFFNVRGGSWFDERPTHGAGQEGRYERQLREMVERAKEKNGFVLLLEVGAGFNTPSVVRWPSAELVARYGGEGRVKMVRVNLKAAEVGVEVEWPGIEEGADDRRDVVGVKMGAREFCEAVGIM
ncbi:hypothetical protein JCM8097_002395 [Rhodosporidiobolus ruineniae]